LTLLLFFILFFSFDRTARTDSMAPMAGEGVPLFYITIVMLTLSWIFATARIGVRRWKNNFGLDDWLMFTGLVCITDSGGISC
jgi:hypothetical protein